MKRRLKLTPTKTKSVDADAAMSALGAVRSSKVRCLSPWIPTPEETVRANRFHCYRRGWVHGAQGSAPDPNHAKHHDAALAEEYLNGHTDGSTARAVALGRAQQRTGYKDRVLR